VETNIFYLCLAILLAPLIGACVAYLMGRQINRNFAHVITILGVGISTVLSLYLLKLSVFDNLPVLNQNIYAWAVFGNVQFHIGFLIDRLSLLMMSVVTFISLMVHIYTIGYMHDDPGYARFFSYISFFTFAMLSLVMSNNFLQLFFGWEGVGVASYLLIGFWYTKPSATFASLKAFLVNRVGDFGFLLGIGVIFYYYNSVDYQTVFSNLNILAQQPAFHLSSTWTVSGATLVCILLFIGAMGKSAQVPLHVWLPDSMEGPTPISALIHAATMVTAGVFLLARFSSIYELSEVARSTILVIGATTAFFMGLLGLVQNDIKRVIAYSTLSQLGYMMVAMGASAYAAGMFHLMTHAFFKALLFLAAGSVIIAMHHEQDIRKMGNLKKYMPITYITSLIGSIALCGIPPFSGFFSKESIIDAVGHVAIAGSSYAYWCVLLGAFVTALYSFRLLFLVFHTKERMDEETRSHLHETGPVITVPLILLAIPSMVIGGLCVKSVLFETPGFFDGSITVLPANNVLAQMAHHFHGVWQATLHSVTTAPFWLAIAGVVVAWLMYIRFPRVPEMFSRRFSWIYRFMLDKYGFDRFNQVVFAGGIRGLGQFFWKYGDVKLIDGVMVNGTADSVGYMARIARRFQTGFLYQYAFVMLLGLLILITLLITETI
jgi:NADH-quinone oxidoreductase subunit L